MTNVSAFFDEFAGATILMIVVLAINDKKNVPPPAGLAPLVLFFLVLGIGSSFGMQTGTLFFNDDNSDLVFNPL
jgi:aquaglyceroporin related protein